MARSRTRKTTKPKRDIGNQVLGPRPFKDNVRKGVAWGIVGIANAEQHQAKGLARYATDSKNQLSKIEYAKIMKCATTLEKIQSILHELAAEMEPEIAARWKMDPTIESSTPSGGRKVQEPPAASESRKPAVSKKPSGKRKRATASHA